MCPGGVKADLSLMSLEVLLIVHIIDDQLGRHCIACVFVDYFEFSRDWVTLGAIFTTTTRNLYVCDVIMKMVY